jgi:hypothetical protein
MEELPSKERWQNCYSTVEDDFLEIDAIVGDIIFYEFAVADHISLTVKEKGRFFFGPLLKKKQELGGTGFINKACILYKRLLGTFAVLKVQSKFRRSKFSQMEES